MSITEISVMRINLFHKYSAGGAYKSLRTVQMYIGITGAVYFERINVDGLLDSKSVCVRVITNIHLPEKMNPLYGLISF